MRTRAITGVPATLLVVLLVAFSPAVSAAVDINESDWQVAFNSKMVRGELEVPTAAGRVDIVTDTHAIEVDNLANYREGLQQALEYAGATQKIPGLALYIDGVPGTLELLTAATDLCLSSGITLWIINEYVTVEDLCSQKQGVSPAVPETPPQPTAVTPAPASEPPTQQYWLNTSSGVRHNRSCRWFANTKRGRFCGPSDGRACGICGG